MLYLLILHIQMIKYGDSNVMDGIKDSRSKLFTYAAYVPSDREDAKINNDNDTDKNTYTYSGGFCKGRYETAEIISPSEKENVTRIKMEHKEREKDLVSTFILTLCFYFI